MSYNSSTGIIYENVSIQNVRQAVRIEGTASDTNDLGTLNLRNYGPEYALYRPYNSSALIRYYNNANNGKPPLSAFKNNTRLYPESYYTSGDIYKDENYGWNITGVSYTDVFNVVKYDSANGKTTTVVGAELKNLSWSHRNVVSGSAYRLTDWLGYFNMARPKVIGHTADTDIYLSVLEDEIDNGDDVQALIDTNGLTSANIPYCVPAMDHFFMQGTTKKSFSYLTLMFVKHTTSNAAVAGNIAITPSSTYSGLLSSILRRDGVATSLVILDHNRNTYGQKKTALFAVISENQINRYTDCEFNGLVPLPGYFARASFHSFYMEFTWVFQSEDDRKAMFTVSATKPSSSNRITITVQNNTGFRIRTYDVRIRMNDGSTSDDHQYARNLTSSAQAINGFTSTVFTVDFDINSSNVNNALYKEDPRDYSLDYSNYRVPRNLYSPVIELVFKFGYRENNTDNYTTYSWKGNLTIT